VLNGGGTSFIVEGNGELLDKWNPLVELPDRKEPGILRERGGRKPDIKRP
jgi:hypothetical protein